MADLFAQTKLVHQMLINEPPPEMAEINPEPSMPYPADGRAAPPALNNGNQVYLTPPAIPAPYDDDAAAPVSGVVTSLLPPAP